MTVRPAVQSLYFQLFYFILLSLHIALCLLSSSVHTYIHVTVLSLSLCCPLLIADKLVSTQNHKPRIHFQHYQDLLAFIACSCNHGCVWGLVIETDITLTTLTLRAKCSGAFNPFQFNVYMYSEVFIFIHTVYTVDHLDWNRGHMFSSHPEVHNQLLGLGHVERQMTLLPPCDKGVHHSPILCPIIPHWSIQPRRVILLYWL